MPFLGPSTKKVTWEVLRNTVRIDWYELSHQRCYVGSMSQPKFLAIRNLIRNARYNRDPQLKRVRVEQSGAVGRIKSTRKRWVVYWMTEVWYFQEPHFRSI